MVPKTRLFLPKTQNLTYQRMLKILKAKGNSSISTLVLEKRVLFLFTKYMKSSLIGSSKMYLSYNLIIYSTENSKVAIIHVKSLFKNVGGVMNKAHNERRRHAAQEYPDVGEHVEMSPAFRRKRPRLVCPKKVHLRRYRPRDDERQGQHCGMSKTSAERHFHSFRSRLIR